MPSEWMEKKADRAEAGLEVWEEGTREFFGFLSDKSAVAQAKDFMITFSETMGAMAQQSGVLNPLKAEVDSFFEAIGGGIAEQMAPALATFTEMLGPFTEKVGAAIGSILEMISNLVTGVNNWLSSLVPEGTPHPLTGEPLQAPDLFADILPNAIFGIPFSLINLGSWFFTGNFIL